MQYEVLYEVLYEVQYECPLYIIHWSVFLIVAYCVLCAVRTEYLYAIRAVPEVVSHRFPTTEGPVRSQQ